MALATGFCEFFVATVHAKIPSAVLDCRKKSLANLNTTNGGRTLRQPELPQVFCSQLLAKIVCNLLKLARGIDVLALGAAQKLKTVPIERLGILHLRPMAATLHLEDCRVRY